MNRAFLVFTWFFAVVGANERCAPGNEVCSLLRGLGDLSGRARNRATELPATALPNGSFEDV